MKCQQTAKSQLTRENIYIANATAAFRTVTYTYDAWGNCTATVESGNPSLENSIVNTYNPFRYRGYYYDYETRWYS